MGTSSQIYCILFSAFLFERFLANPLQNDHIPETSQTQEKQLNSEIFRSLLDNNFENGKVNPWLDESPNNVHWVVEDFSSPLDPSSPAPTPSFGSRFLRANRTPTTSSGLAILRSPPFTALPGDKISFNFWLRSRHPQGNTLKVYWLNNTDEQLIMDLTETSSPSNFEWRRISTELPVTSEATTRLIIYGYTGGNAEDAIGIDDITLESAVDSSTVSDLTSNPTGYTTEKPDCNRSFTEMTGSFSSPNYPSNYPNNAHCQWLIVLPIGFYIHLEFKAFTTQYATDYVRV